MEMREGPLSPADKVRFSQWRLRSAEHALAWEKATLLLEKFQTVPPHGVVALKNTSPSSRRATIKALAALLAIGPVTWVAYRHSPLAERPNVIATAKGEVRNIVLEDGTDIVLNTATTIQVQYDEDVRHVRLLSGEILVSTATDARNPARPFVVQTAEGHLRPIGTRFTARQLEGRSYLAVYEGAVEITPGVAPAAKQILATGYGAGFTSDLVEPPTKSNQRNLSWTNGMLVADQMPLSGFAAELARYRPGLLQVASDVGTLPVSGVFPLKDTTASLTLLEQTMPVRIHYFTRYWVRIVAK